MHDLKPMMRRLELQRAAKEKATTHAFSYAVGVLSGICLLVFVEGLVG